MISWFADERCNFNQWYDGDDDKLCVINVQWYFVDKDDGWMWVCLPTSY